MKRKILASDLNREVMRLREQCACANKALREVEKQCNSLSRLCRAADPDASQQPFQNSREEQPRSLPPEHRQHHPSTSRRCR